MSGNETDRAIMQLLNDSGETCVYQGYWEMLQRAYPSQQLLHCPEEVVGSIIGKNPYVDSQKEWLASLKKSGPQ